MRDLSRAPRRRRAVWPIAARTVTWCAALYLTFVALWGLNYRRPHLRESMVYDATAVTADAAVVAGRFTVERLNALHAAAHTAGWPEAGAVDQNLELTFARAVRDAGIAREVVPGRPKRTVLDWYFRRAGVDG